MDNSARLIHIVKSRDLDKPAYVVREQFVPHDPLGQLVPFGC